MLCSFVNEICRRVRKAEKGTGGRTDGAAVAVGACSDIGAVRRP
jgi:hypothetical protein